MIPTIASNCGKTSLLAGFILISAGSSFGTVAITVDLSGARTEISPYIYGLNDWTRSSTTKSTGYTFDRLGGNRMTGYNWETNASNAGSDWYHSSDNYLVSTLSSTLQVTPGEADMQMVDHDRTLGIPSVITLQLAGYVSADEDGIVTADEAAPSTRWKAVKITKGSTLSTTPDTTDDYVYMDEQVNFLINKYGTAADGGVLAYETDNEASLWSSTHPRLHPDVATVTEIVSQSVAAATMVKNLDSSALIFGPVSYGWSEFMVYQNDISAGWTSEMTSTYGWFLSYYLAQMKAASDTSGERLLDVLDIHYYSSATGDNSSGTSTTITADETDTASGITTARLQAPRSLWDTTYEETSWITEYSTYGPIYLIPRLQTSIDTYYPDTRIAITEYDFGGHAVISGGIAQADVLGIFGKYGVYAACYWGDVVTYMIPAFQIYRNYDSNGSTFGDLCVPTTNPDAASYSTYASTDSVTGQLHLIAINKTSSAQSATITLSGTNRVVTSAKVYGFSEADGDSIVEYTSVSDIESNSFAYSLPAYSVLHFVFSDPEINNGIKVTVESSTKVAILFDTVSGNTYKIQSSADLSTWTDVGAATYAGDGGVFKVEIDMPTASTFWRVAPVE